MANFIQIPRPRVPQGGVQTTTSVSDSPRAEVFESHENRLLAHLSQSPSPDIKINSFLYCWDPESIAEDQTGGGAAIFNSMRQECDLLAADAHFALLLHVSINLSHHLGLSAESQAAFNRIVDDRSSNFDEMQTAVFKHFGRTRKTAQDQAPPQVEVKPELPFQEIPSQARIEEVRRQPVETAPNPWGLEPWMMPARGVEVVRPQGDIVKEQWLENNSSIVAPRRERAAQAEPQEASRTAPRKPGKTWSAAKARIRADAELTGHKIKSMWTSLKEKVRGGYDRV